LDVLFFLLVGHVEPCISILIINFSLNCVRQYTGWLPSYNIYCMALDASVAHHGIEGWYTSSVEDTCYDQSE